MFEFMVNPLGEGAYAPAFAKSRERMRQLTPAQIAENTLCRFDQAKKCFHLESFSQNFEITYPEGKIYFAGYPDKAPVVFWGLIVLNYLSAAQKILPDEEWVSYRELPEGNVFYPSIRNNELETLGRFYSGCNRKVLRETLEQLGFTLVNTKADTAAKGYFTPRIPVLLQFWDGEDDIPASCQILFDRSVARHMHIEDIAALCTVVTKLVIGRYNLAK